MKALCFLVDLTDDQLEDLKRQARREGLDYRDLAETTASAAVWALCDRERTRYLKAIAKCAGGTSRSGKTGFLRYDGDRRGEADG